MTPLAVHEPGEHQRGSAIVTAMLLMTVFVLIGGAFLSVALTESVIAANEMAGVRAFHAADAGLEHARSILDDADIQSLLENQGGQLLVDAEVGNSLYSVVVSNNTDTDFPRGGIPVDSGGATDDTDGYLVLTSTGRYRSASRTVQAVVQSEPIPGVDWTVFGDYYLSAHVTGTLNGLVGTNKDMILRVTVDGDAQAGGIIDYPGYVTGTATMGAPQIDFPDVPCPTGEYGPSPIGPGVDFDAFYGDVTISGSSDTTLPGGTYFFFDFEKSGSGRILVQSGDTVDLFVRGELNIDDIGFQNDNDSAARLRIWGCGTRNDEWRIAGDSPQWMFVYAPHHPMRILGTGVKNGSYIAASVFKSGAGPLVYDGRLAQELIESFIEVPGTWHEVSR